MTQVTQLIIKPSQGRQTKNLVLAIIDITKKCEASPETMAHIQILAAEAIAMMDAAEREAKPQKKGDSDGFKTGQQAEGVMSADRDDKERWRRLCPCV